MIIVLTFESHGLIVYMINLNIQYRVRMKMDRK